ncbi:lysophospholipid acyltransferase family protein [Holophaga foetida]|uniref:lysophospholipid acyltransferase family protein n=1 Tax=Holophaga foetida TaxID=35839 RepID=UPI0002473763|nr:lysophospholipid acyltransferase family protein [Holophaga foetida]
MKSWRQNPVWKAFLVVWGLVSVCLTALGVLIAAIFLGPKRAFFTVAPLWVRQIFPLCGVKWSVRGWEDLPEEIRNGKQPVIFMSNHESHLDPPFLIHAIPIPAVYIAKKEVKWMPLVGWAAWAAGTIFIDRGNREKAVRSLRLAAEEIRGGKNVLIFPEGTRTRNGKLGSFKKGGFNLAMDAGVPIVPLATVGGYRILPADSLSPSPGRFDVLFGQPVRPGDYPDREAILSEVRNRISDLRERAGQEA